MKNWIGLLALGLLASGCAGVTGVNAPSHDAPLLQGPPVSDVTTPFDHSLSCLDGRINKKLTFAAGAVIDQTGKEQFTEGGSGKFVTQGAGDIVQSALFKAGATVVNRRDPRIMVNEVSWKIRDPRKFAPAAFYVTGSINSLDFIPGAGLEASVSGVGPRYRQHRILVGLDMAMTETSTGRVVANVSLQKQITAEEYGIGIGRFFGDTLVTLDAGGQNREAVHFALRGMLNLAVFELLTQIMAADSWRDCGAIIEQVHGIAGKQDPVGDTPGAKVAEAGPPGVAGEEEQVRSAMRGLPADAPPAAEPSSRAVSAAGQGAPDDVMVAGLDPPFTTTNSELGPEELGPAEHETSSGDFPRRGLY